MFKPGQRIRYRAAGRYCSRHQAIKSLWRGEDVTVLTPDPEPLETHALARPLGGFSARSDSDFRDEIATAEEALAIADELLSSEIQFSDEEHVFEPVYLVEPRRVA